MFWGVRLIKDTVPVSTSKFKNPAVFNPSQCTINDSIYSDLLRTKKDGEVFYEDGII